MSSVRRPWTKRSPEGILALTDRDRHIVQALAKFRFLTTSQLSQMFFGSKSKCDRRLRQLFDHGFVDRIERPAVQGKTELIYALWKRGAELIEQQQSDSGNGFSWTPVHNRLKSQRVDHELSIVSFHLAVERAIAKSPSLELLFWNQRIAIPLPRWRQNRRSYASHTQMTLIPDAVWALQTPKGKTVFCLEVDRGTEPNTTVMREKFRAYDHLLSNGAMQTLVGMPFFRVLAIANSKKRMDNLISLGSSMVNAIAFWFSISNSNHHANVILDPIWRNVHSRTQSVPLVYT